jgi:hypothetical protein
MTADEQLVKRREVAFMGPHPDRSQAHSAMLLLSDVEGVVGLELVDDGRLAVSYDVTQLTMQMIEAALEEVGFHLDGSLLARLKRALHYYTDATHRANLGLEGPDCGTGCAQKVFIQSYRQRRHGCRDERPAHWRRYL